MESPRSPLDFDRDLAPVVPIPILKDLLISLEDLHDETLALKTQLRAVSRRGLLGTLLHNLDLMLLDFANRVVHNMEKRHCGH